MPNNNFYISINFKHFPPFYQIALYFSENAPCERGGPTNPGRSIFHRTAPKPLLQPPLLWHFSRPLPVSGKLPACSPFHQEPQEMSLAERWSLIKNKWMGCPRDRVNGQRIAGVGALKCRRKWGGGGGGLEGQGRSGEQSLKFEPITMFLYSDESRDGRKQEPAATRGPRQTETATRSTSRSSQALSFLFFFLFQSLPSQRAPDRHGPYKHGLRTLVSVLARARAKIANIDPFLLCALDTITLMPWMEAQTFQACHTSGLLANH